MVSSRSPFSMPSIASTLPGLIPRDPHADDAVALLLGDEPRLHHLGCASRMRSTAERSIANSLGPVFTICFSTAISSGAPRSSGRRRDRASAVAAAAALRRGVPDRAPRSFEPHPIATDIGDARVADIASALSQDALPADIERRERDVLILIPHEHERLHALDRIGRVERNEIALALRPLTAGLHRTQRPGHMIEGIRSGSPPRKLRKTLAVVFELALASTTAGRRIPPLTVPSTSAPTASAFRSAMSAIPTGTAAVRSVRRTRIPPSSEHRATALSRAISRGSVHSPAPFRQPDRCASSEMCADDNLSAALVLAKDRGRSAC